MPDGKRMRIRGTPLVDTRRAAELAEREHIERLLHEVRNPETSRKEVPTLNQFKKEFMATYVQANNKPSERMAKEYMFTLHLLPVFGRKRLDEITTRDVEEFKADKLEAKLAPKTVNNMLSCLGKTLRYAAESDIIDKIPRIRFVRVFEQPFDFLDFEEYDRRHRRCEPGPGDVSGDPPRG